LTSILFALCAPAAATSIDEVANPRQHHNGWVTDAAGVIPPAVEAQIEQRIQSLNGELGAEIAVVTLQQVDTTPKEFATGLFNRWRIGGRENSAGMLVLLVVGDRRVEMETGYGLEPVLPDSWLGEMQRRVMVPQFKEGDYALGLDLGLGEVAARLRRSPTEVREGTRGEISVGAQGPSPVGAALGVGLGGLALGGVGLGGALMVRRRRRRCPDCKVQMPMLDEVADNEHLHPGQRTEEEIGSVDHLVHACPQCDNTRAFESRRWLSGYTRCPQCRNRTRSTRRTTIRHATQTRGGTVRIEEECAHCTYDRTYRRSTPRIRVRSRGRSGGFGGGGGGGSFGGGSFGGGSSGGGGAGSSW